MWRRLSSSQLKALAASIRSAPKPFPAAANGGVCASPAALRPAVTVFSGHFSTESVATDKTVEDVMPIATGHEREELEAKRKGKDIHLHAINYPVGPFGTKEAPAIILSYYNKRIVGCPGGEGEDEHDVVWFWLEKDKPQECPVCSQHFALEVVGHGGDPEGHSDDKHH